MNLMTAFEALRAMPVLEALTAGTVDAAALSELGFRDAGAWQKLAGVYFGPTRHRKLQAAARDAAVGLSLDALGVVEKNTRRLLSGAAVTPWELRVELCALRGTVAEIDQAAAARVRDYNRGVEDAEKKAYGGRSLKGGKNTDARGLRTATFTGPEHLMAAFLGDLHTKAQELRRADPRLSYEQAMFDALLAGGAGVSGPVTPVPHVVIGLPDYAKLLRQEGDETIFALTDGTTITGAELVAREMATVGVVGLYDPISGGVNMYREERFATWKQRMLLAAETILCPHPGCTTPASQCQVHHLIAWEQGGETNIENLSMACAVHNARNDDDPNAPPRNGRLERRPGGVVHLPPDGGPPRENIHPIRKLSAMALINN
ncbi:HNH endonuclease signature motif containing protein [Corynebacterium humireducens]|nr:HNH endonuclease signature motif containing protein [Corynebacterium humireducens]